MIIDTDISQKAISLVLVPEQYKSFSYLLGHENLIAKIEIGEKYICVSMKPVVGNDRSWYLKYLTSNGWILSREQNLDIWKLKNNNDDGEQ